MKTVVLDGNTDYLMEPVSDMLSAMTDSWMVLEKYVPDKVLSSLQQGKNPLNQKSVVHDRLVLFGDFWGSTSFAEKIGVQSMVELLESFFEISIEKIHSRGGTVSKLLGDGLMAYFPVTMAEDALDAITEIAAELKKMRILADSQARSLVYAGFGMSAGRVFEGNLGSKSKLDYTLIGDTVNTAARLQELTRKTRRALVFDESVLPFAETKEFQKVARLKLRGKENEIDVYSLRNDVLRIDTPYESLKRKISALQ